MIQINPIELILLLGLSAALTAWAIDHLRLSRRCAEVIKGSADAKAAIQEALTKLQSVHNESAAEFLKLAKKVEDMNGKIELHGLFRQKKPFKEETRGAGT